MAEFFEICLIWVPGHKDIPGNCIADELVRRGTTDIFLPDKEDINKFITSAYVIIFIWNTAPVIVTVTGTIAWALA
ncbi:hypothetical protein ACLKA6_014917 [Drosophila palustris]